MVSIIIINYHVKKELFACIESIISSKPKTAFEIIMVDNDEEKTIQKELHKKFPKVIYIPNENKGFGQANNVGAIHSKGKYLFFLNPDTRLINNCLDLLTSYLDNHKDIAILAPLLFDKNNAPYQLQGVKELTPLRAIVALSFLNKLFPNNKIFHDYYLREWDKKTLKEVDVVPGTSFMIRKSIFEKIGGFDEKFFLYFEEFDLCKRVKLLGWKIFIYPEAKVYHAWGSSTGQRDDIKSIFQKSRFYYFKKHFGTLTALITECFLRVNKYTIFLLFIVLIGVFLRTYRIYETMPFIGDQGWFYLSARDLLVSGKIPLVGIATSHPWLHQGALWTYILSLGFFTFGFNPYTGVYISIFIDVIAIYLIIKLGSLMFSQRVGMIAGLLYAASPIVILNSRMPYHTSPIPLLALFYLLSLVQWIRGKPGYFPAAVLSLALLYNLEIATFPLASVLLTILAFGFWKKKKWASAIINKKIAFYSAIAFLIPMIPMLIYDFGHGFPQTFGFLAWIGYKFLILFGYPPFNPEAASQNFANMISFITNFYKRLVFLPSNIMASTITVLSFAFFYVILFKQLTTKKYNTSTILLGITFTISLAGIIATKTTSEAYLPILFPASILIIAIFFDKLIQIKSVFAWFIFLLILLIPLINAYSVIYEVKGHEFSDRFEVARKIVLQTHGRRYNLIGEGIGSEYPSFIMNYEYLTWWMGNGPSKDREKVKFIISEDKDGIHVKQAAAKGND